MVSVGLFVPLHAKPGKEEDVARFLEGGLALVEEEPDTTAWFAIPWGRPSSPSSTRSRTTPDDRRTCRGGSPRR